MLAPAKEPSPTTQPQSDQSSLESWKLYAQAADRQLSSMNHYTDEDRERMCAHAVFLGAQRGWTGIEGIGPNNATAHHRAGEFLCVAGKSHSPDPSVNGVAVPINNALNASAGEWLNKADTARQEYALTKSQAQTQTQSQSLAHEQPQNQGNTLTLSRL